MLTSAKLLEKQIYLQSCTASSGKSGDRHNSPRIMLDCSRTKGQFGLAESQPGDDAAQTG